jgi:hypothetical protein
MFTAFAEFGGEMGDWKGVGKRETGVSARKTPQVWKRK